jgi:hypothetical protein
MVSGGAQLRPLQANSNAYLMSAVRPQQLWHSTGIHFY